MLAALLMDELTIPLSHSPSRALTFARDRVHQYPRQTENSRARNQQRHQNRSVHVAST
jgi:hypothetical protein